MLFPFGKTTEMEAQVDEFLDIIIRGALVLKQAIACHLEGRCDDFAEHIAAVSTLEHEADEIRRNVETALYAHSLIPESRGDVLGLLENMDNVIDRAKQVLQRFEVEQPEIPKELHDSLVQLADLSVQAVDNVVSAARSFFRAPRMVRDHINKVDFYESEADRVALKLKRQIFNSSLELPHKMHLRYFVEQIETISDIAENVGERLAIATIKRSL